MERPWIEVEREREKGREGERSLFGCLTTPADRCCLYERGASTLHILSLSLTLCLCVYVYVCVVLQHFKILPPKITSELSDSRFPGCRLHLQYVT